MDYSVSIIIPIYNRANLIGKTLDSVLAQTYTNWECLVVDDGSTDDTENIVKSYVLKDNRFKLFHRVSERLKGASTCRNIGLENAQGAYIQFLDSDDLISENKLLEQINLFKESPDNNIATCKWGRFNKNESDLEIYNDLNSYNNFSNMEEFLNSLIKSKGYFPIHAYLIKHSLIRKVGCWNEKLILNDDGEFIMRLLPYSEKVVFSEKAIAFYRWGVDENLSKFNNVGNVNDAINSWKMIEFYFKIMFKKETIPYIEYIKDSLFINVKNSFPDLIKIHSSFFQKQFKNNNLFNKVLLRLRF